MVSSWVPIGFDGAASNKVLTASIFAVIGELDRNR